MRSTSFSRLSILRFISFSFSLVRSRNLRAGSMSATQSSLALIGVWSLTGAMLPSNGRFAFRVGGRQAMTARCSQIAPCRYQLLPPHLALVRFRHPRGLRVELWVEIGESQETAPDRGKRKRTKPDLPFSSLTTSISTWTSPSCSSSSFTRAWTSSSSDSAISLSSKLCSTCSCRSSNLDWTESRSARRSLFCESASKSERLEEKAGE